MHIIIITGKREVFFPFKKKKKKKQWLQTESSLKVCLSAKTIWVPARKNTACADVSLLFANIFIATHSGRGHGALRWRVAYCTYKSLSLWHAVRILSAGGRGLTLWSDMKRLMVCVQEQRGMRRRCLQCVYVLRCGRVSVCIHGGRGGGGACEDSYLLRREIKKQDQQSRSPVDCFIFRFILHHIPPLLPSDLLLLPLLWSEGCGHCKLPGPLWSRLVFVFMSVINREEKRGGQKPQNKWSG